MTKYKIMQKCELCNVKQEELFESMQYDKLCIDCYLGEIGEYDV